MTMKLQTKEKKSKENQSKHFFLTTVKEENAEIAA